MLTSVDTKEHETKSARGGGAEKQAFSFQLRQHRDAWQFDAMVSVVGSKDSGQWRVLH